MNPQRLKICVFTAARSDYFLLRPLLYQLKDDKNSELQLIVSGMHMSPEFGETGKLIENDGFSIAEKVSMLLSGNKPIDIVSSMGLGLINYANLLSRLSPHLVVILGDRFEMISFSIAAYILNIPIAHIHGGELTYGSFDDGIRHSITKMAALHFPATEVYRRRIIQMGEYPDTVFNVGALAVENIKDTPTKDITSLAKDLRIDLKENFFLVTLHPETLIKSSPSEQVNILIAALSKFPDYQVIWTISNADPKGKEINDLLRDSKNKFFLIENLGDLYIPVLKKAAALIGNSSSGIIEAPIVGVPTINIGPRQDGRLRTPSIIDCGFDIKEISEAIKKAVSKEFLNICYQQENPYGNEKASRKIINILKSFNIRKDRKKRFFDISKGELNV